jgi:hypothetical protein
MLVWRRVTLRNPTSVRLGRASALEDVPQTSRAVVTPNRLAAADRLEVGGPMERRPPVG